MNYEYRNSANKLILTQQPNIIRIKNFFKVIRFCVELSFSPNAKCYKILMIIFPAKYCFGEADTVGRDVF